MTLGKNTTLATLSVVTPCYDEQDVLPAFYKRVIEVCRKFDSYELVLVDDGSTDGTWSLIRSLVEQNPHVVGVRLEKPWSSVGVNC
jgi:polyisoprenyl-phosphate glycosyltransferase